MASANFNFTLVIDQSVVRSESTYGTAVHHAELKVLDSQLEFVTTPDQLVPRFLAWLFVFLPAYDS